MKIEAFERCYTTDFNAHLDPELDSAGGKTIRKDSVKNVIDIKLAFELVDISTLIKNNIHGGRRDLYSTAFGLLAN